MRDWCWHDHGQRKRREDNETRGFVCASQHCEPWTGPRSSAARATRVLSAARLSDHRRVSAQRHQRFTRTTTSPRPIDGDLPEAARGCGRGVPLRPAYGAIEDPDSTRLHKVIVVVSPHVVVAIPNLDGFTMMPCWTIEVYFSQTYPPRGGVTRFFASRIS